MQNLTASIQLPALTTTQVQMIQSYYQGLEQILRFEKGLTLLERRRMMRPTRENLHFVKDSIDAIDQIPELCPGFLDIAEVEAEAQLFQQLRYLEQVHNQVGDALKDLRLIKGNKAFSNARLIYRSVQSAAENGYPKARPIYTQMRRRFAAQTANLPGQEEEPLLEDVDMENPAPPQGQSSAPVTSLNAENEPPAGNPDS